MASVTNVLLSMTKSTHNPSQWTFNVEYDAGFDASDLAGPSFRDGFRVMERTGDINQILTGALSGASGR